jgi:hypothetical protein
MTVLYGTFGEYWGCVKRFIYQSRAKQHLLQIHLLNETCRVSWRRCLDGEILRDLSSAQVDAALRRHSRAITVKLTRRVKTLSKIIEKRKRKNTRVILSVALEDRWTNKGFRAAVAIIKRAGWEYELSRSLVRSDGSLYTPASFLELHGVQPTFKGAPCIYNSDGDELNLREARDATRRYKDCLSVFLWTRDAQGVGDFFVEPRRRDFRISDREVVLYRNILGDL